MKAIVLTKPGNADVLTYTTVPTPTVKPGWSLIKVKGFGINRSEIFTRNGWSPLLNYPEFWVLKVLARLLKRRMKRGCPRDKKW